METNEREARAKTKWNAKADSYNQWDALGEDERAELIEKEKQEASTRCEVRAEYGKHRCANDAAVWANLHGQSVHICTECAKAIDAGAYRRSTRDVANRKRWRDAQDGIVRQMLAEMSKQRLTSKAMCQRAGISQAHWSELRNLRKPLTLDKVVAIVTALGMTLGINLEAKELNPN